MTPSATKQKPTKDPIAKLAAAEADWLEFQAARLELGTESEAKKRRMIDLQRTREDLCNRFPEQVDHTLAPLDPDNDVGKVDAAIAELGDLSDLAAKVAHAERLEQVARQRRDDLMRHHRDALHESRRDEGEAMVAAYVDAQSKLAARADDLVAFAQRSMEIEAVCGRNTGTVPIEDVAALAKAARAEAESTPPVPLPPIESA